MPFFKVDDYCISRGLEPPKPIDDDRCCLACGYALRGLHEGRRCPECGRPITPLQGQGLAEAQTPQLEHLALTVLAAFAGWVTGIGVCLWVFFEWLDNFVVLLVALSLTALAFAVVSGTRVWGAIHPHQNRFEDWLSFWLRALFTITAALTILLVLSRMVWPGVMFRGAFLGLSTLTPVAWIALQILGCLAFRSMAVAGQDEGLAERFWHLAWAIGLCAALIGPVVGLTQSMMAGGGLVGFCCMGGYLVIIAMLVVQLLFAHSLLRLHAMIRWSVKYRVQYDARTTRMMERIDEGRKVGDSEGSLLVRDED